MNTFAITTTITPDQIANQIITAFESGGIGYWAAKTRPVVPSEDSFEPEDGNPWYARASLYENDFKIRIVQQEEHETGAGLDVYLTPDSVQKGLELMAKDFGWQFRNLIADEGDADTSDVFVQLCVFGKLIYG